MSNRLAVQQWKAHSNHRGNPSTSNRLRIALGAGLLLGFLPAVYALSSYLTTFVNTYPATQPTPLNSCVLCHINPAGGGTRNAYGEAFRTAGHSFSTIESLDSDGDGYTNIQEISAGTFPGDSTSHPGSTTDITPPTITSFVIATTSSSLTVPITKLTASDNMGVTGYLVTESSTKPAASASGWSATPITSYTFAAAGTKALYAWAKDAAANVSNGVRAGVVITLPSGPDTTPPTVSGFSLPANSTTLTVTILSLTATDNIGVTGYLLTTSSTSPSVTTAAWSTSAPTNYTFNSAGTKTLYAWAKDAAGNLSAGKSASTSITLPVTSSIKSINSTSQNRVTAPQVPVSEQSRTQLQAIKWWLRMISGCTARMWTSVSQAFSLHLMCCMPRLSAKAITL